MYNLPTIKGIKSVNQIKNFVRKEELRRRIWAIYKVHKNEK